MIVKFSNAGYVRLIDYLIYLSVLLCLVLRLHYPPYAFISDWSVVWTGIRKAFGYLSQLLCLNFALCTLLSTSPRVNTLTLVPSFSCLFATQVPYIMEAHLH